MNRTFTLKRLFINITVLCVVFALIRAWPGAMLRLALYGALFLPTVAICVLFIFLPPRRFESVACAAAGALFGFALGPQIHANWGRPPTWWDLFKLDFSTIGVSMAIGAFVLGGLGWIYSAIVEHNIRREEP